MKDITENKDFEIVVRFLPTKKMRYDTLGDYQEKDNQLSVHIAREGDFIEQMAILLHELTEWALVHRDGISLGSIDAWDMSHTDSPEPGEEVGCPYREAHAAAMDVEKTFRVYANIPLEEEGKLNAKADSATKYLTGE
jgi:hypothetical protein